MFEKDFKRNYVHIRDVADCFLHCIENADAMIGMPYNVGLDAANLSKAELVEKIKEYVPSLYVNYSEIGSDPDKRNYIVSNQRIREEGGKKEIGAFEQACEKFREKRLAKIVRGWIGCPVHDIPQTEFLCRGSGGLEIDIH